MSELELKEFLAEHVAAPPTAPEVSEAIVRIALQHKQVIADMMNKEPHHGMVQFIVDPQSPEAELLSKAWGTRSMQEACERLKHIHPRMTLVEYSMWEGVLKLSFYS